MRSWVFGCSLVSVALLAGCASPPPGVEVGPHGTIAYDVLVEASPPGARIEVNQEYVGNTPLHLKVFGDKDGTFHDFGSYYFVIQAFPLATNQFVQTRAYRTGRNFTPEDRIPQRVYFDMNQPPPPYPAAAVPYPYPDYGPPVYYGPPFYYGPPYYGPAVRFYYGPGYPYHRHW